MESPKSITPKKSDVQKDNYEETLNYIAQIEKEIDFQLGDQTNLTQNLNLFDEQVSKLNKEQFEKDNFESHWDGLLSKIAELDAFLISKENLISSKNIIVKLNMTESDKVSLPKPTSLNYLHPKTMMKKQNRYSVYDNSTKFPIFDATASLLKNLPLKSSREQVINPRSFGGHPSGVSNNGKILPDFLENAFQYLTKFGMNSVGIFRKSGVKSRINGLKNSIEQHEKIDFKSLCVYDVADLVKTWIRELSPHLISKNLIETFMKSPETFHLWQLEDGHRYLLFCILQFLSNVASNSSQNQMNVYNLAVCFAPSMCEFENELQIADGQKCLEFCIENHEILFDVAVSLAPNRIPLELFRHTAKAIIPASSLDILNRIRIERNLFDPFITNWSIKDESQMKEIFEMTYKFSDFMPSKTFKLRRFWNIVTGAAMLREESERYCSTWDLRNNGTGATQVIHELEVDLGGFSHYWYSRVWANVHDQMIKDLLGSFQIDKKYSRLLVSEV